VIHKLFII